MMENSNLCSIVSKNLVFQHLWTEVETIELKVFPADENFKKNRTNGNETDQDADQPGENFGNQTGDGYYNLNLLVGKPPQKLDPNDTKILKEFILPTNIEKQWTLLQWKEIFSAIEEFQKKKSNSSENFNNFKNKRLLIAILSEDSTIVYYFLNEGLIKPRKN